MKPVAIALAGFLAGAASMVVAINTLSRPNITPLYGFVCSTAGMDAVIVADTAQDPFTMKNTLCIDFDQGVSSDIVLARTFGLGG